MAARRGPLPPRRGRPRRPRRRPRGDPGPLRGVRGRRLGGRRRARPPRLHAPRCSPSTRTPSTRCSPPIVQRSARDRPRGRGRRLVDGLRGAAGRRTPARVRRPRTAAGDGAGVDRPAVRARVTGSRRWSQLAGGEPRARRRRARSRAGSPGTHVAAADPEVVVVAPCGFDLDGSPGWPTSWSRAGCCRPAYRCWAVDANASLARPGAAPGRRDRGAGRHPACGPGTGPGAGPAPAVSIGEGALLGSASSLCR